MRSTHLHCELTRWSEPWMKAHSPRADRLCRARERFSHTHPEGPKPRPLTTALSATPAVGSWPSCSRGAFMATSSSGCSTPNCTASRDASCSSSHLSPPRTAHTHTHTHTAMYNNVLLHRHTHTHSHFLTPRTRISTSVSLLRRRKKIDTLLAPNGAQPYLSTKCCRTIFWQRILVRLDRAASLLRELEEREYASPSFYLPSTSLSLSPTSCH